MHEQLAILRSIAQRGVKLAQAKQYGSMVDNLKQLLDEINRTIDLISEP